MTHRPTPVLAPHEPVPSRPGWHSSDGSMRSSSHTKPTGSSSARSSSRLTWNGGPPTCKAPTHTWSTSISLIPTHSHSGACRRFKGACAYLLVAADGEDESEEQAAVRLDQLPHLEGPPLTEGGGQGTLGTHNR